MAAEKDLKEKEIPEISFTNTEIAFQRLSNRDLKKAYWLFKMISNPTMVNIGKHLTNFALAIHLPIKGIIKKTIFKQFVGGETIEDASRAIDEIKKENVGVFKISGIGSFNILKKLNKKATLTEEEQAAADRIYKRCDRLCKAAHDIDTPILIDAEESWIQDSIDEMVEDMMSKYNQNKPIVYQTVQMYRHDRLHYLKRVHQDAIDKNYILAVKIVRGAYMEKERDRNNPRIYFAQLYGMSDCISFNLSKAGYNVGKYVPYGPIREVMPYLIRRAQENTSAAEQTGRELSLIIKELKRRKMS